MILNLEEVLETPRNSAKKTLRGKSSKKCGFTLEHLERSDWIEDEELEDVLTETKELNAISSEMDSLDKAYRIPKEEWKELLDFMSKKGYQLEHTRYVSCAK